MRPSRRTFDAALAARALVFLPFAISTLPLAWARSRVAPLKTYREAGDRTVANYVGDFRVRLVDWRTMDLLTALGVRDRSFLAAGVPNDDFSTLASMAAVRCCVFFNGYSLRPCGHGTCEFVPAPL